MRFANNLLNVPVTICLRPGEIVGDGEGGGFVVGRVVRWRDGAVFFGGSDGAVDRRREDDY